MPRDDQARLLDSVTWCWLYSTWGFFKENVSYPVWICRDPISDSRDPILSDFRDPMIIFCDSRDPNRVPKTP